MARKVEVHEIPPFEELCAGMDELYKQQKSIGITNKGMSYRRTALEHYRREIAGSNINVCVICGFGIPAVLEVAHLDQNRANNDLSNLAVLCPNCHKMHDIGLLPTEVVKRLRDEHLTENWGLRVKDAGVKAAATKKANAAKKARSSAAKKAWENRTPPKIQATK